MGPRALRAALRRLRVAQRSVSRRLRRSYRRRRAGLLVARLHERIRNLRRDHAFKLANDLVRRFDVMYVEALHLKGLAGSRLAREIQDQAWGAFLTILTDKAAEAGRSVIALDARNTSQWCSACGALVPKPLKASLCLRLPGGSGCQCRAQSLPARREPSGVNVARRGVRCLRRRT